MIKYRPKICLVALILIVSPVNPSLASDMDARVTSSMPMPKGISLDTLHERALFAAEEATVLKLIPKGKKIIAKSKAKFDEVALAILVRAALNVVVEEEGIKGEEYVVVAHARLDEKKFAKMAKDIAMAENIGEDLKRDYISVLGRISENQKKFRVFSKRSKVKGNKTASKLDAEFLAYSKYLEGLKFYVIDINFVALDRFVQALRLNDDFFLMHKYIAMAGFGYGADLSGLIDHLNKYVKRDKDNPFVYEGLGLFYIAKGDPKKALDYLNRGIRLNSKSFNAYNRRSTVYYDLKKYDLALKDCQSAIEISPEDSAAWHNIAMVRFQKGAYEGAIKDATKSIQLEDGNAEAHFARGVSYLRKGDKSKGNKDLEKSCSLSYRSACNILHKQRPVEKPLSDAWKEYLRGNYPRAIAIVDEINAPDDLRILLFTSYIAIDEKRPIDAINAIEKINRLLKRAKKSEDNELIRHKAIYLRGVANYMLKDCEKGTGDALKYLKNSKRTIIVQDDVFANDIAGICYAKQGEYVKSEKYLKQGFKILENYQGKLWNAYIREAYNLASLKALMGDAVETSKWLEIVFRDDNAEYWIKKMSKDDDFDKVRKHMLVKKILKKHATQ